MTYKYKITQGVCEQFPYVFIGWDRVRDSLLKHQIPDALITQYEDVYSGTVEADSPAIALEELFRIFNIEHPEDYRGRSLSVSDIVILGDADGNNANTWFCDIFGWQNITDWIQKHCSVDAPSLD